MLDLDGDAAKVAAGAGGLGIAADVSQEPDVQRAFAAVFDAFGRVDVLVNNAGISGGPDVTLLHTTSVEDFDRVHGVNSRGVFLCSKAVLPAMIAQGGGTSSRSPRWPRRSCSPAGSPTTRPRARH